MSKHADIVGFANYRVVIHKTKVGFKKTVTRGAGGGERVLYLAERPAFIAKNRYGLPDQLPLTWDALAGHLNSQKKEAT